MRHRRAIIISLLAAVVLVVVGASMLSASPDDDSVDITDALEALAVLNTYFGRETGVGLLPVETATPAPDVGTSTPTLAPAPTGGIPDFSACEHRFSGKAFNANYFYEPRGRRVVEGAAQHVDVHFVNYDDNGTDIKWTYGFTLVEGRTQLHIFVTRWGRWIVRKGHYTQGDVLDSGSLSRHGIELNLGVGVTNRLTFRTRDENHGYGFYVNGQEVPVNWPALGLPTAYSRHDSDRAYYVNGYPMVEYQELCAVDSW